MDKYTFKWNLTPPVVVRVEFAFPPFDVNVEKDLVTLIAFAQPGAEKQLRAEADQISRNIARILTYQYGDRFEVGFAGTHILHASGQQSVTAEFHGVVALTMSGQAEVVIGDASGKVIDSSVMQRERERILTQARLGDLMQRAVRDANLRDMLDHWRRYAGDPDGRLHPLYDVLQVIERLYGTRKKAAFALGLTDADLSDLGRISNDPTVLNGRHPGKSTSPHRTATDVEVATCERVAKEIIDRYASNLII